MEPRSRNGRPLAVGQAGQSSALSWTRCAGSWLAFVGGLVLHSGCGFGTAAAVAGATGSDSPSNGPSSISAFEILDAKESPARLRFIVSDPEGDVAQVEFFYSFRGRPIGE